MGREQGFTPQRLIMGVLISRQELIPTVIEHLVTLYGPLLDCSEPKVFSYTDYYDEEMDGKPLRFYLSFKELVDPSCLAAIKRQTDDLEKLFCEQGNRRVNLDPGLLSLANLILATTKNRAHRIPLRDGIYAELTLLYANKQFQSFPWTYADYKSEVVKELFSSWRESYRKQMKQEGPF
ncbi:MAG: DUF4416 family protein [Sphaerochaetaceae bacterium]